MAKVRAERKESIDKKDSNFVELVPEASQRCPTGVSPPLVPSSTRPGRRQAVFGACAPMAEEWLREITAGGVQGNVAEIEIQQELAEVLPPPSSPPVTVNNNDDAGGPRDWDDRRRRVSVQACC